MKKSFICLAVFIFLNNLFVVPVAIATEVSDVPPEVYRAFHASPSQSPLGEWQWRNPLPQGNRLSRVRFGNGFFLSQPTMEHFLHPRMVLPGKLCRWIPEVKTFVMFSMQ